MHLVVIILSPTHMIGNLKNIFIVVIIINLTTRFLSKKHTTNTTTTKPLLNHY